MTVELILLGTGTPEVSADRASAATVFRRGDTVLMFDAGRAAVLRLAQAGIRPIQLAALFISHRHSDHVMSVNDVAMSAWFDSRRLGRARALPIHCPRGDAATVVRRLLDAFEEEVAEAQPGLSPSRVVADIREFEHGAEAHLIWEDQDVRVSATSVPHGPPSVAYRIESPEGAIVHSGDTPVSDVVETLSHGAAILVHEVVRAEIFKDAGRPYPSAPEYEQVLRMHAGAVQLGAMAQRAGVPTLILTHFLPVPRSQHHLDGFVSDVRQGGYTGEIICGSDLLRWTVG